MRRTPQLGQKPRRLQLKATRCSAWQLSQRTRRKPCSSTANTRRRPAQFSRLGSVVPFGLLTPTQFLPGPPPQLESSVYAEDFNEIREKGSAMGSTRLAEETRAESVPRVKSDCGL